MDNLKEHRREVMKGARYLRSVNSKIELIARLLSVREQQKVHDYVPAEHRVEQFDHKTWWASVTAWWVIVGTVVTVVVAGLWVVDAYACDLPPQDETINEIRAEAI